MFEMNQQIAGVFLMSHACTRKTKNGVNFITGQLHQGEECIRCIIWSDASITPERIEGSLVYVSGIVTEYRGEKQVSLDTIYPVDPSSVPNVAQIIPTAPINEDACFAELVRTVQDMQDQDLRKVCQYALDSLQFPLRKLPAAKSIHHAFVGGLLMHITMMLQLAKAACNIHTSVPGREGIIDRDLLFAGVILHDIGKIKEFRCYDCGLVAEYTPEGRQFGHSILGARILSNICRLTHVYSYKTNQLENLLLTHHGSTECGAAADPMTLEAILLSQLDSIDSKIEAAIEALLQVKPGGFTEKLYAFGGRQLYKPVDSLEGDAAAFEGSYNDDWIELIDNIEEDTEV